MTIEQIQNSLILSRLSGLDVISSFEALTAAVNSFGKIILE